MSLSWPIHPLLRLKSPRLARLTAVRPSPLLLLVPRHAGPESNVHPRGRGKPKRLGKFHEVQLVDVKDGPQGVGRVGVEVASVAIFGTLIAVRDMAND